MSWALEYVQNIQINSSSVATSEIPLTFYPIAKNIRIPSSHMARNILNNTKSTINNYARNGEPDFWQNTLHRGNWYPWLWARGRLSNENYSNIEGWQYYFKSFTQNHEPLHTSMNNSPNDSHNTAIESALAHPPENLKLFFIYLACIKYTFQLNDKYVKLMSEYREQMQWPELDASSKILAVQIRRGETCTKDGSKTDREYFPIDYYIQKIELLMQHNKFNYIYISTDSDEEIDKIKAYNPNWKLLYLPIDRKKFFRMQDNANFKQENRHIAIDLEDSCRQYPESIPFIVDSGIADLYFISMCHGYISTISESEFSRCGWFLQMATQSTLTPYIDVNTNKLPLDMSQRDKLLLI
jgi:hypothetical protein